MKNNETFVNLSGWNKVMNKKIILSLALTLLLTTIGTAATWNVPANGNIQTAIDNADSGDTILLEEGTYKGSGRKNLDFGGKNLMIDANTSDPRKCIIDCEGAGRAFYFHNGETEASTIRGITIRNGDVSNEPYDGPSLIGGPFGGAIECFGTSPIIENCIIEDCKAMYGGAIDILYGSPIIINCVFKGNTSEYDGSAIEIAGESMPQFQNVLVHHNTATRGFGAIDCYDGAMPEITNCTIADNSGAENYGGICSTDGGIITNSIISGNGINLYGSSFDITYSCIENGYPGAGNISSDPMFKEGYFGDYYLSQESAGQLADSECVNAGINNDIFLPGHFFTTNTYDIIDDDAVIDMGFHYPASGVTEKFMVKTYVDGSGMIDPCLPAPGQYYKKYGEIEFAAIPETNFRFVEWIYANSDTFNPLDPLTYTVIPGTSDRYLATIDSNTIVIARFDTAATYQLKVFVKGGNGTISNVVPNNPDLVDPSIYYIPQNTSASISAAPNTGYIIKQWLVGETATFNLDDPTTYEIVAPTNPYSLVVDTNMTVAVEFKYQQYLLTTSVVNGNGTITPKRGYYPAGTTVTLTASPNDGYRVFDWTVDGTIMNKWNTPTYSVVMNNNKNVQVQFEQNNSKVIHVYGDTPGLQDAINNAGRGDIVQIHPGTYQGIGFEVDKAITIIGDPENPENVVFDWQYNDQHHYVSGITLKQIPDPITLNGITFKNLRSNVTREDCGGAAGDNGPDNDSHYYGAIQVDGSHRILNCVIEDCELTVTENSRACDGVPGGDPCDLVTNPNGGNGGKGGDAGGAGISIISGSPEIRNVLIDNCRVYAGDGGWGAQGFYQNEPNNHDPVNIQYPPGYAGHGGFGGNALGGGICIQGGAQSPTFIDVIVRNCKAIAGNGGQGATALTVIDPCDVDTDLWPNADPKGLDGGNGNLPGRAYGGGIFIDAGTSPKFVNCLIEDCAAYGGKGGDGGNATASGEEAGEGGFGGLCTQATAGQGDIKLTTGNGGGVFCDMQSSPTFIDCTILDNIAYGSISGMGGQRSDGSYWHPWENTRLPANGAGVMCDSTTLAKFESCHFENNRTATADDYSDPNKYGNFINFEGSTNLQEYDGEYTGIGGGLALFTPVTIDINDCNFISNQAPIGGGVYALGDQAAISQINIKNSNVADNNAYSGAGVMLIDCNGFIRDSLISGNKAGTSFDTSDDLGYALYGTGGGLYAMSSLIDIQDSYITGNSARVTGGGICFDSWWSKQSAQRPLIKNCIISDNNSVFEGGGIASIYAARPLIQNCTIVDNYTTDAEGTGGGIYACYSSDVIVKDSILWQNSGSFGSQIALSSSSSDMPAKLRLSYSDIGLGGSTSFYMDGPTNSIIGISKDAGGMWSVAGSSNINADPLFTSGYYLSHLATNNGMQSPCVDMGSDEASAVGMDTYTTRLDGVLDSGTVDIGYHYKDAVGEYDITVRVVDDSNNPIDYAQIFAYPDQLISYDPVHATYVYRFYEGINAILTATSDSNHYLRGWYDQSGTLLSSAQSYMFNPDSNAVYTAKIKPRRTINVPGAHPYNTIQGAIDAAQNGDIIIIQSGQYIGTGFTIYDKDITISSSNPDNPNVVANTIIDCEGQVSGGFYIYGSGTTVLNGLTIINATSAVVNARDGDDPGENGGSGGWNMGGALTIYGNHKIMNCVIRDSRIRGGNAGNGANGDANPGTQDGGRGGDGGDAAGAGLLIYGGSPLIKNCSFENCVVEAGNGGNGGNGNNDTERRTSGVGGQGGYPGKAYGAAIAAIYGANPTFENCTVRNCRAIGGQGGNGGNSGDGAGSGGFGAPFDGDPAQDSPTNHSSYGAGIYIGEFCDATFKNCTVSNNTVEGSSSGLGGFSVNGVQNHPRLNYEIPAFGGGVYCDVYSSSAFEKCNVTDNNTAIYDNLYVGYGGGIAIYEADSAKIVDCNINYNAANTGGGFYALDTDQIVIDDTRVTQNNAYIGGGLFTIYGAADINNSEISLNIADWYGNQDDPNSDPDTIYGNGGGIYSFSTEATIRNTKINSNIASASGGGIYFGGEQQNTSTVFNCLITENRASSDGAGLSVNWFADVLIQNCTIAENAITSVFGRGGGLYCAYEAFTSVVDSIFRGNTGIEGSEIAIGGGDPAYPLPGIINVSHSNVDLRTNSAFEDVADAITRGVTTSSVLVEEQTIYDQINSTGSAKVIVTLVEPESKHQITDWSNTTLVNKARNQISLLQNQVLSGLSTAEFSVKHKLTNAAIFSGTVNQSGLEKLLANPKVAHIEPVRSVHYALAQGLPLMNAMNVRNEYNGSGIAIAIVDSGVDYRHSKLGGGMFPNSKVIGGYDTGNNDNNPMPFGESHGTNCAGIAAGNPGSTGDYIGGVAQNAKIYALKAGRDDGALLTNDFQAAWDWCITHKNDDPLNPILVISNSWGSGYYTNAQRAENDYPSFVELARTAKAAGITILASSGNDGFTNGISFPAALSDVISVGAVYDASIGYAGFGVCTDTQTQADQVTCYSNTADILDILAPSHNAFTTDIIGIDGSSTGDYYAEFGGTSAACPYAAGAVAVLQNAAKEMTGKYLSPEDIRTILSISGDPVTDTKAFITKPRINLEAAVVLLGESTPIFVEEGCPPIIGYVQDANDKWLPDANYSNHDKDPNFVFGYYLSSIEAGQDFDSPLFDLGSTWATDLGLDTLTTRTDDANDFNMVDLGYHYWAGIPQFRLHIDVNTADANASGTTIPEPNDHYEYAGSIKKVEAVPGPNSRVAKWIIDGITIDTHDRIYPIIMDRDHDVTVQFEFYTPRNIIVPDQYGTIQEAIDAAEDGDTVYIYRKPDGKPHYIEDIEGLDLKGKAITIRSENPDDPNIVAETIIDCNNRGRAFIFRNGETSDSNLYGLTIINGLATGPIAAGTIEIPDSEDANIVYYNGNSASGDGYGGGIYIDVNSSPMIRKCVFKNCQVTGAWGANGLRGYNLPPNSQLERGGRGGDGGDGSGNGYGGAIFCDANSDPTILDCTFIDNIARGGIGGDAGDGGYASSGKTAGDGGNGGAGYGNGYGGSVYLSEKSSAKVLGCSFTGNAASIGVGGLGGNQGQGQVPTQPPYPYDGYNGTSNGSGFGGVLYYEEESIADINNCSFIDNTAIASTGDVFGSGGGAIYLEPNCVDARISNSNLAGNKATAGSGGSILVNAKNKLTLENCFIGGGFANVSGGAIYSGSKIDANETVLKLNKCVLTGNRANESGGAVFAKNTIASMVECYINRNTAHFGGGLNFVAESSLSVIGGTFMENKAVGDAADGGGVLMLHVPSEFINCQFISNTSEYGGGGIMMKGPETAGSRLHNCLFAKNIANVRGGAVLAVSYASPEITSCTFSQNQTEVGGLGGGVFCTYSSSPMIRDCIFDQTKRIAVYENSVDSDPTIDFCFFNGNFDGDFFDFDTTLYNTCDGNTIDRNAEIAAMNALNDCNDNLISDILKNDVLQKSIFRTGDLGDYYLKQQPYDNTILAVNHGSDRAWKIKVLPDNNMMNYTTRFDSNQPDHPNDFNDANVCTYDQGQLDIGFHYMDTDNVDDYNLTISVIGDHGTMIPAPGVHKYPAGTTVQLTAIPDTGWRVKNWYGTDDDSTTNTTNYVVVMSHRTVAVEFEQPKDIYVPAKYTTLQEAINASKSGDKIIVASGVYQWFDTNFDYAGVRIWGKNITITSTHPDDPCVVAATIFRGSRFNIMDVDQSMILDGITIEDAHYLGSNGRCPTNPISPDGVNGASINYGAMIISNASPTIRNVRFVNCSARGGNGTDNCSAGGDGGWAGYARGGAVNIESGSPAFKNCQFINCYVEGGNGGNGDTSPQTPGHGGNWGDPNGSGNAIEGLDHTWDYADGRGLNGFGYAPYWFYSGYGGAVYCSPESKPLFEKCLFSGNRSSGGVCGISASIWPWPQNKYVIDSFGGAVYIAQGSLAEFTDCNFVNNLADTRNQIGDANLTYEAAQDGWTLSDPVVSYGGAICAEGTAIPVIKNCQFKNNLACAGGSMYWEDSVAHISKSDFTGNSAMLGGALLFIDSNSAVSECEFIGNRAVSPAGQGGAIYSASSQSMFYDCLVMNNIAAVSGGGAYFTGEHEPNMHNCILTSNTANRDGGGISANWDVQLTLSNCTLANNEVTGGGFAAGFGGGLSCAYEANTKIINSILWNNNAEYGREISIGNNFEASGKRPAEVTVNYSDIQGGGAGVFFDYESGCKINGYDSPTTNLDGTSLTSPSFVTKLAWGEYFLGAPDICEPPQALQNLCIDFGLGTALENDMFKHTTRTDLAIDKPKTKVDLGYHYVLEPTILGDFNFDRVVNLADFILFMEYWMDDNCTFPYYCAGRDFTEDGEVDFEDYALFAENYQQYETQPPKPDPMTWDIAPRSLSLTSITMKATDAKENSGAQVYYFFECVSGGGHNSGWITDSTYIDSGLTNGTQYGYRVRASDGPNGTGNKTKWSIIGYAVAGADTTPPEPNQMEWLIRPHATSSTTIEMSCVPATDVSGVQYYFEERSGNQGGSSSGWIPGNVFVDSGLQPETTYTYRVRARDNSYNHNNTAFSGEVQVTTPAEGEEPNDPNANDILPPEPNPSLWATVPRVTTDGLFYYHTMTAVEATDLSPPVQYEFACVDGGGTSSGWILSNTYTAGGFWSTTNSAYRVRTKDARGNIGEWSVVWHTYYGQQ